MSQPIANDEEFIKLFTTIGPTRTAQKLGIHVRKVFERRRTLEAKLGSAIPNPRGNRYSKVGAPVEVIHSSHKARLQQTVKDGVVLVGSDHHYWPGDPSTAHRAFVHFVNEFKPKIVVANGDVLDGSTISRHPPIGWESRPSLAEEVEACKERLSEMEKASKNSLFVWTLGNHDARFETRLATVAPEYAKVHGVHLKDHFPRWSPCWALWVNDVVIKHRQANGIHAVYNNALRAGKTMVTGHLHSLKVTPWTDYTGTRYGVDTGCIADTFGPQFNDYMEDGPRNWRAGFVVLTFIKHRLMWPEVVAVVDENHVEFRGELIRV